MLQINPPHVYLNMSAAAGISSTFASTDPEAVFKEKRNQPVVIDASKYKLAVTRLDVATRNLPLYICPIAQTDPVSGAPNVDPDLTAFSIQLTMTRLWNDGTQPFSITTGYGGYVTISTFNPAGALIDSIDVVLKLAGADPTITTRAAWAAFMQTKINAAGTAAGDSILTDMAVAADDSNRLVYKSATAIAMGMSFTIDTGSSLTLWNTSVNGDTPPKQARMYGMLDLDGNSQPITTSSISGVGLQLYTAGTFAMKSVAGVIVSPNQATQQGPVNITQSVTVPLRWVPQISGVVQPGPPSDNGGAQVDSLYYWGLDYQSFVTMVNNAFNTGWLQLGALFALDTYPYLLRSKAPYIEFVPASKTFALYADAYSSPNNGSFTARATRGSTGLRNPDSEEISVISFNEMLQSFLMLPCTNVTATGACDAYFVNATRALTFKPASTELGWDVLASDFSPTAAIWSPVGSLVMLTNLIPVRYESVSTPGVFGASSLAGSAPSIQTSYDSVPVLSDVIINLTDASNWRAETILYSPTILRWIDMPCGEFALDTVDIQLAWRNRVSGAIVNLTLSPLASFSIKILLQRIDTVD